MNRITRKAPRALLCLLLACCLLPACALLPDSAKGESPAGIRVQLRRLNLTDRADLALTGRYLARSASGAELLLSDQSKVTVRLEKGQLVLFSGGVSMAMGSGISLLRQESGDKTPGIRFNLQDGFYPGDLTLSVEEGKIVPILSLPLETYLRGVVPYEMGDGFPEEALKAQAVCARTYALNRMNREGAWDVVDNTNDQVFRGLTASPKSQKAVEDTAGLVLTCDGKLITAWYSASNGGQTELPANIWKGDVPRCFAMVDDPWDAANPAATLRTCVLNRDGSGLPAAFVKLLHRAAQADPLLSEGLPPEESFRIRRIHALELLAPRYAAPSRLMTKLKVSFELVPSAPAATAAPAAEEGDVDIAALLADRPLSVTLDLFPETVFALGLSVYGANNEIITLSEDETAFTLTAGRYGHGVGLSQRGAQQMASEGKKTFQEILAFYFPGAVLKRYTGEPAPLPTPPPLLAKDPGPAPTATPRPTLMPVTQELPEGARRARVENIAKDSSLNLRAQPSAGAEVLRRLYYGQELMVLEQCDIPGWVHVKTDAAEGYVMESFLTYEEAESTEAPKG